MTQPAAQPRRAARRAWLAAVLAALLAGPSALAPAGAAAHATSSALAAGDVPLAAPGGHEGAEHAGGPGGEDDPDAGPLLPSVHYRHAEEHAADAIDFEPGERVNVPFTPRAGDDWAVDGGKPRPLPAGHATGRRMRDSQQGSVWAAGRPADVTAGASGRATIDGAGTTDGPAAADGAAGTGAAGAPAAELVAAIVPSSPGGIEVAAPVGPSGLRREVFGFLPYWELSDDSTVLDWRTLSTVAYFSVGCTSSGNLLKRNADGSASVGWAGWTSNRMTSIINAAHQHQTRVVLTVSCFAWSSAGAGTQAALLGSSGARSTLAKQIAGAVRDRGADGANLDFEPIVAGYADEFTNLVRKVRAELNAVAPGYQLTFDTMGSIGNQPIVEATAPGGADAVFIMGYDYRTASASVAGSHSPLTGPIYDLTDTVKAYTAKIAPSKLILGVPYYGRAWSTPTSTLHAKNISGAKYGGVAEPFYAEAVGIAAANGRRWDSVEQSPWAAYRKETCTAAYGCVTSWRQLYYDDAASLKRRYDLVNRSNLRGAGIWALGYDGSRTELRAALADKFLADRTAPATGVATLAETQRDEGFRVAWSAWDDSTIRGYDVQASVDGGPFATWLSGTTLTSAIFLGTHGRRYAFRVRATDVHGNASAWNGIPFGSAPGGLAVGAFAGVVTDGLRMRSAASTGAAIMATLEAGDALQVIGGPVSGEGYAWYQVTGPLGQWPPVDAVQVGGWVAATGNGATNVVPRTPVYATRIDAGITSLKLAGGGARVLTPNGDGVHDTLPIDWVNRRSLDAIALRVYRTDGTLAGTDTLGAGKADAGANGYDWDGRLGGSLVPPGAYVIQLQGTAGAGTYHAPSASPVTAAQVARVGVVVGHAAPTSVVSITSNPVSPTRSRTITFALKFGGTVQWLSAGDVVRSGTATGCRVGTPTVSGSTWFVVVSECSTGTVKLTLKAKTVMDAVSNWGPATNVGGPTVVIDRTAPTSSAPKATLSTGVGLASISTGTGILASLGWGASDAGGAGIAGFDVRRSRDGGPFELIAAGHPSASLAVSMPPGHTYRFEVRPRDRAGNVGAWKAGPTLRPALVQDGNAGIAYGGSWRVGESSHYSAEEVRFATAAGASAKLSFTGRGIALVATRGPDRGAVKVILDGVHVATVDTHASEHAFRSVVYGKTWASSGFHTVRLVVVGTGGRPRFDLDAFEILR